MCYKEDIGIFLEIKGGSRVFKESVKCITRKFGCFNGVLIGFQRCSKEVQWVFEERFMGVSRILQGSFKGVTRKI